MVKMKNSNREGTWKMFAESDVEAAKANGWVLFDTPKPKKKAKKDKGDK